MRKTALSLALTLLALGGCQIYPPTPNLDYSIKVMPTANGMAAVPPTCPGYAEAVTDPYDNQPVPQFGCANARNLAMMVEQPKDLVSPQQMGAASGTIMSGAIYRYNSNQTRGLIWTGTDPNQIATTTAPAAASPITGVFGGTGTSSGGSSGGSSSSSTSTTP